MATKKTEKKAAPKAAKPTKTAKAPKAKAPKADKDAKVLPRHPKGRVAEGHGSKEALAKSLAAMIARSDQDTDALEVSLKTASNQQLLRLSRAVDLLKSKWGNRDKLIAAIGSAQNKGKDKDYLAKLDSYSLPQLLDLAKFHERAART